MADVPVLVCTTGELAGRRIPVPEGGLGIGRSPENSVVIHDEGVSRYHGRLLFDNGSLWLQDAGSRNGVFVNGVRVTGHKALKVGDAITIAEHTFELRWHDEDEAGSASLAARGSSGAPLARDRSAANGHPAGSPNGLEDSATSPPDAAPRRRWYWPFS